MHTHTNTHTHTHEHKINAELEMGEKKQTSNDRLTLVKSGKDIKDFVLNDRVTEEG